MPDVLVPLDLVRFVRKVWLPANPNKLRSAAPETVAAAKRFIAIADGAPAEPIAWAYYHEGSDELLDVTLIKPEEPIPGVRVVPLYEISP